MTSHVIYQRRRRPFLPTVIKTVALTIFGAALIAVP